MEELNKEKLDILRHALGNNYSPRHQRNFFCASLDDGPTMATLSELVRLGLMRAANRINEGRDQYFIVTEQGIEAVRRATHKPAKLTRGQRRYQQFLRVSDVMSFREFLSRKAVAT